MSPASSPFVLGIDVGTSGVRSIAVTAAGEVLGDARAPLADLPAEGAAHEQDPESWWRGVCQTLNELRRRLESDGQWTSLTGLSVTSTSGSLVLVDSSGEPLRPAMLYDDGRAASIAQDLNRRLPPGHPPINASFSLAKALWVRQHEPVIWRRARNILHPADWLVGRLTGQMGVCDYSNALKLGFDPEAGDWIPAVGVAEIPKSMFPRVVAPGDLVGNVSPRASNECGVTAGVPVVAGASDGLASLVGSGASEPGHANTTLGTTLVWKVLTAAKPQLGPGMYCHNLPNQLRVPGAASNTGPGSLRHGEQDMPPAERDRESAAYLPTSVHCYLLGSRGERFPVLNRDAEQFFEGCPRSLAEQHAAQLQSLACVERWGYERLEDCGVEIGKEVYSAGSAAASPVLSQLRADVLNRNVRRTANPTASFGAAILAASALLFEGDLTAAMRSMNRVVESHAPQPEMVDAYNTVYEDFRAACARHGFE